MEKLTAQNVEAWGLPQNDEVEVSVGIETGVVNGNVSLMVRTASAAMMVILPQGVAIALMQKLMEKLEAAHSLNVKGTRP